MSSLLLCLSGSFTRGNTHDHRPRAKPPPLPYPEINFFPVVVASLGPRRYFSRGITRLRSAPAGGDPLRRSIASIVVRAAPDRGNDASPPEERERRTGGPQTVAFLVLSCARDTASKAKAGKNNKKNTLQRTIASLSFLPVLHDAPQRIRTNISAKTRNSLQKSTCTVPSPVSNSETLSIRKKSGLAAH
ncbi:hypothetical protein VUR80DRAFT_6588 [Thermomyces stellatus]